MRPLDRLVQPTTQFVLSETTRQFIERIASEAAAETMKDEEFRRELRDMVRRHFDRASTQLKSPNDSKRSRKTAAKRGSAPKTKAR